MRTLVRTATALLLAITVLTFPKTAGEAHLLNCTYGAHDPHESSGLGVVAKSTITCPHQHDRLDITVNLYICPDNDFQGERPSEAWVGDNCFLKDFNADTITPQVANKEYTRQAPMVNGTPVHGRGYWVQCTIFHTVNNGNEDLDVKTSHVVFLDV